MTPSCASRPRRGYTLLEALFALIILCLALLPLGEMMKGLGRWNFAGRDRDQALQLAREEIGRIRTVPPDSLRDSSWTVHVDGLEYGLRRDVEDSADVLRRFPEAKVDALLRPTALRGPQEARIAVWKGKDTLVVLPLLRAREGGP